MPGSTIIKGHSRPVLFNQASYFVPAGGQALGTFMAGRYSRFAGFFSCIASLTFQYSMAADSASTVTSLTRVSSAFTVNSGKSTFDVLNYGQAVSFEFTAAYSQSVGAILIYGEPIR